MPMSLRRVIYCLNVVGTRASLQLENRLHCAKFNKAIHASTSRFLSFSTAIARSRLERPMKVTVRMSQLRNYLCGTKSHSISSNISLVLTNLFIDQMQKCIFFTIEYNIYTYKLFEKKLSFIYDLKNNILICSIIHIILICFYLLLNIFIYY